MKNTRYTLNLSVPDKVKAKLFKLINLRTTFAVKAEYIIQDGIGNVPYITFSWKYNSMHDMSIKSNELTELLNDNHIEDFALMVA